MDTTASLAGILGALSVGVVSPGPSFVMVSREALALSRSNGVAAAVGLACGSVLFAFAGLLGLNAVLLAFPQWYRVLGMIGGAYLALLGTRIFMAANSPLADAASTSGVKTLLGSFNSGLATQLSNPKTAIVYSSVFAVFMPSERSTQWAAALICLVFILEASWYSCAVWVLSSPLPRARYAASKKWIDWLAGSVMIALGLRLVLLFLSASAS
jgi:threonine/homoserine/homoserine lactone efflux protein